MVDKVLCSCLKRGTVALKTGGDECLISLSCDRIMESNSTINFNLENNILTLDDQKHTSSEEH